MKPISIIKAPLVSEEFFSGVSLMADALMHAGLAESLGAKIGAALPPAAWEPRRDPDTKILNPTEVAAYSVTLADAVGKSTEAGDFPLVVGGDCTVLIGSLLALKRKWKPGLFFIDGHADFYQPGVSPSGETADMELGFVTGRGPDVLADLEGRKPLVEEADTVLFGFRDEELIKQTGGQDVRATNIHCVSLDDTRYFGFNNAVEKGIRTLVSRVDGFWIHLDLDVLSDEVMPAVDYRMGAGLSTGELVNVLRRLVATGKAVGMSTAIFNPTLDWDLTIAKTVVALLAAGLRE